MGAPTRGPVIEPVLYSLLIQDLQEYAVFLLDTDGRVTTWNAGAERIKGYTESEIIGQHIEVFYPPDDIAAGQPDQLLVTAARDGRAEYEGWRVRKDGSLFWANVVCTAIKGVDGQLIGFGKVTRDLTERRAMEQEIRHRALHDDLTGLPNRALLLDRLDHALGRLDRHPTCLAVMFIDLDNFKRINDTRGHETGDNVLQEVAQRLHTTVRPQDTIGRLSGDEFLAICEDLIGAPEAHTIATRCAAALSPPVPATGGDLSVSASIGIAVTTDPGTPANVLLRRADEAMYKAKRHHGSTTRIHLADHASYT